MSEKLIKKQQNINKRRYMGICRDQITNYSSQTSHCFVYFKQNLFIFTVNS